MDTLAIPISHSTADKPPRSKRLIPVSLMMFVALLVLLLVATLMSFWLPYYREQKVIQKIRDLGGKVEMETGGPEWLRQFVGNEELQNFEVFKRVFLVNLDDTPISNAGLATLCGLANPRILYLRGTDVSDAGVTYLSGLTTLGGLHLRGTAVSDSGVERLQKALPDCVIRR